jgi:hypothetical protein
VIVCRYAKCSQNDAKPNLIQEEPIDYRSARANLQRSPLHRRDAPPLTGKFYGGGA